MTLRYETSKKIDPETNAVVELREDGVLKISYVDNTSVIIFPDHSRIYTTLSSSDPEAAVIVDTYICDGLAPVKRTYDPIKARARTIIGLGGTDALMGKDSIMERSYGGLITEVLLPDNSTV